MRIKDPGHWTSDWKFARYLMDYYQGADGKDFTLVCLGDPEDPIGGLGPAVGDEIAPYYANTLGTSKHPVGAGDFPDLLSRIAQERPGSVVILVESMAGDEAYHGTIDINERGVNNQSTDLTAQNLSLIGVHAVFARIEEVSVGRTNVAELSDVVIDGFLRFFHKLGQDDF